MIYFLEWFFFFAGIYTIGVILGTRAIMFWRGLWRRERRFAGRRETYTKKLYAHLSSLFSSPFLGRRWIFGGKGGGVGGRFVETGRILLFYVLILDAVGVFLV